MAGDDGILTQFCENVRDFLEGPAYDLTLARIEFEDNAAAPNNVVYGWQSELPEDAEDDEEGLWHIVKVEARTPRRCHFACGNTQLYGSDPGWPRIHTYTKSWGTSRCYQILNRAQIAMTPRALCCQI